MATALRQRMVDEMTLRHMSPRTIDCYVGAVAGAARFYRRSPDQLTAEEIPQYLLYLEKERHLAWNSCNVAISGLRFFYENVLRRPEITAQLPARRGESHLPRILTQEEVSRILAAAVRRRDHALLMTVYGAGLRVSEVTALRPCHIDSSRRLIRVEQGKGRKDRYTILPDRLLDELRRYWRKCRPGTMFFPGQNRSRPLTSTTAERIYNTARAKAGITRGRGIHTLRHCFCTDMLDAGYDIFEVKEMMGHRWLSTTMQYRHVSPKRISQVRSPLDGKVFA